MAAFVVTLADSRILAATPPCEALGLRAETPAPLSVKAVTRAMGSAMGHPPRLERIRLPNAFVPRLFSCATLPSAVGPVVLFADPASIPAAPELPHTELPRPPASADQRPVRFTWEMDGDARVTFVSPTLQADLSGFGDWRGRTLRELEQDGLVQGVAAALSALEGGATFANVTFHVADASGRRIEIGGVPLFDAMRRRVGWRGFGLIWPGQACATPVSQEQSAPLAANVVPLRGGNLSARERSAFDEIARTLSDAIEGWPRADDTGPSASSNTEEVPTPAPGVTWTSEAPTGKEPEAPPPAPPRAPADEPGISDEIAVSWDDRLLDHLPVGLAVQQDGAIIFLNETLLAWLSLEDVAAFHRAGGFGVLLTSEGAGAPLMLRTLTGESPVDVRLIRANWRGRPAVIHVVRLLESAGETKGAEEVKSEAGLNAPDAPETDNASARQAALDLFAFPLLVLDPSGSMVQANGAAAGLCEYPLSEIIGEPFTILFAPESQRQAVALLDQALAADGELAPITLIARSRTGERRTVEVTLSRPTGAPPCVCLALRTISTPEARPDFAPPATAAGTEAVPSDEDALGHFARRVSHGVRSPLNGILGFVESVRASTFGPVGNSRYSRQAEAAALAAQQLLATLEDVESLARPASGEAVQRVELATVVASAVQHLAPAMKRRRQIIRSDVAEALFAQINGDILAFIVRSVLEEAVRATPGGGQIMVSASSTAEGGLCLLIRDSGPALSEPQISQALNAFVPATASDRFSSGGRPFRMARLAAVLRANGGEMHLRRGVETGMLCELHLPA